MTVKEGRKNIQTYGPFSVYILVLLFECGISDIFDKVLTALALSC